MSLYGALEIGVAGLTANSAALSVSSSNIANVNTVGYKDSCQLVLHIPRIVLRQQRSDGSRRDGKAASIVTSQGLLNTTSSPTDLSISGNGFFVVNTTPTARPEPRRISLHPRRQLHARRERQPARTPRASICMGWPLDANGNVPTNRNSMSPININNLSGKAQATSTMTICRPTCRPARRRLRAMRRATWPLARPRRTSSARSMSIDSQGGASRCRSHSSRPAPTPGPMKSPTRARRPTSRVRRQTILIGSGTLTFNSDGTLANVNGGSPATGTVNITIPWAPGTSGLAPQTVALNMGTVGGSDGITQFDNPSSLGPSTAVNGALFGSSPASRSTPTAPSRRSSPTACRRTSYKIPIATFSNPDGLAAVSGNAYTASNDSGTAAHQRGQYRRRRYDQLQIAGRLDRRSGHRIYQSDHHAACLFGVGPNRHHRRSDAADAGTDASNAKLRTSGAARETRRSMFR